MDLFSFTAYTPKSKINFEFWREATPEQPIKKEEHTAHSRIPQPNFTTTSKKSRDVPRQYNKWINKMYFYIH